MKSYEPADKHVVPYVSQVWSSFKYEVRHGEVPEAIQETLRVFTSLSKRLATSSLTTHLISFIDKAWHDCAEDLENPTYTEQAASILISISQAHLASFRLICPRLLDAVRRIIAQPKSPTHTKTLVSVLNNLLRARRSALPPLPVENPLDTYKDDSITVTRDIYFKLWKDNAVENPTKEQTDIAKQVLDGFSQVVKQRRPANDGKSHVSDCEEAVFKEICGTLAHRVVNCFIFQVLTVQGGRDIDEAAIEALRMTVTYYPAGFGKIMTDFIGEVTKRNWSNIPTERSYQALCTYCSRLVSIGCLSLPEDSAPLTNLTVFSGGLLKVLGVLFEQGSDHKALSFVVSCLGQGLQNFVRIPGVRGPVPQDNVSWTLEGANNFVVDLQAAFPDLTKGQYSQFEPTNVVHSLSAATNLFVSFLQLGIYIAAQLYQHATRVIQRPQGSGLDLCQPLNVECDSSPDQPLSRNAIWRDRYLGQVANIATTVLSELDDAAQESLCLQAQILGCFHPSLSSATIASWKQHNHDMISELSVGVARAIRPKLVLKMVRQNQKDPLCAC